MKGQKTLFYCTTMVVMLMGCKINRDIIPQSQIIKLSLSDTANLKADGVSSFHLTAIISDSTDIAYRNITFNASAGLGTFASASTATATSIVVGADQSGTAGTSIKVGNTPGIYYVSAQASNGTTVFKTPDYAVTLRPLAYGDKLTITADNLQPVADGLTTINLEIASKFELNNQLKLTANLGSFVQSSAPLSYSIQPDNLGNASTGYQMSNQLLPHIINALFPDGTSATLTINPLPSYADLIYIQPSVLTVDSLGGAVTLNVYLKKTNPNAKVSQNSAVYFDAYQTIGTTVKHVGRFTGLQNAVSDANGIVAPVNFYADTSDIDTSKPVTISVSANNTATSKITAVVQVKIKK